MKKIIKIFPLFLVLFFFVINGCEIQEPGIVNEPVDVINLNEEFLSKYNHKSLSTYFQLLKVMAATAKYHNIQKAFDDGYADIDVVMPNMGHHYLKAEYLDAEFKVDKPEILVYSPHPVTSKMKLVAVEYAIPIALSPDPPEGFIGNDDVWGIYEGELWTLHAWVWKYNPDGVFSPFNPDVQ